MSNEMLVMHCSPTLAGIKTGSLFSCPAKEASTKRMQEYNQRFVPKGLRLIPLGILRGRMLLYLFRPARLRRDLRHPTARKILDGLHYPEGKINKCILELKRRIREQADFPHEIGLFLGYPPEDVWGFMAYGPDCAKCSGMWKVYGDVPKAQKFFAECKHCTRIYTAALGSNYSFDKLIVSCPIYSGKVGTTL